MTASADISVCIANWNCRDVLRDCLTSLLRQPQGVALEVVVVDNASTDGAADMIANEFPEVVLVRNSANEGFARASNRAALESSGGYLFFLNNDTVVPPMGLAQLLDYAKAHPEVGLIGPRLRDSDGAFQISYRRRPTVGALLHRTLLLRWTGLFARSYRAYRRGGYDPEHRGPVDLLMGAAVLMPRRVFDNGGKWDEDFTFGGEDLELAARVGQKYSVHFVRDVDITHHGRVSSRINVGFSTESVAIGYVQYLRKTGSATRSLFLYKVIVTLDAPLQLIAAGLQFASRRLRGRKTKASKSLLAARGLAHFLRFSLPRFWRA
jgi:N-acetylglucosaminyl-diphospho-decaprenol L-rhamnosyltransferase